MCFWKSNVYAGFNKKNISVIAESHYLIIILLMAKTADEILGVSAVIHPGEIRNSARWKTMHEDVIHHCFY